ncbi:MAG: FAD-dependent oxidoreductase, partial [Ferruginibacter sp.]|nr:FAD-dependent oxidoreductase [Ferruginibacter sp.]
MQTKKWGIVGGGMMGMTIAHRLAQQGHNVTIFEAAPEVGGLASSWMMNDVEWDKFYHVILLSDFYTRDILRDIGVENQLKWVETKTGFYMGGKLHSMSNSIEFLKFPTLNLIDKFRLGLTIIAASKIKDWRKLEKVPVTTWLKRWSGHNTYQKIWLPLLRAKLGDSYERTSAVFIWATIQRLYGARRSGLKKEMFGYVQGGYRTINNAFQKTLQSEGVSIKTKARVSEISSVNGVATIRLENEKFDFDEVVVTVPGMLAASLIPSLSEVEKKKLQNVEYLGVICVAL